MKPYLCASECEKSSKKYFGVQKESCYCGNQITSNLMDEFLCDLRCPGDAAKSCGGKDYLSVY
ncbi:hypothetical protein BOX15_Mlig011106g1, partial [Macrostomum lignano]